jgi:hypothetical protein
MSSNDIGRPSDYTPELADLICEQLAMGYSVRTVCKGEGMPAPSTIFRWLREHKEFQEQYARAKQESADAMADELLDIVDDGSNDWMVINKGGYTATVVDQEAVQRSKLRAETRKWLMSKMKPKKYGDKLDLTSGGKKIEQAPIVVSDIRPRNVDTEQETS